MLNAHPFSRELTTAKTIIQEAGKIALSYYRTNLTVALKEDNSLVTEADHAVEKFIRKAFDEIFPEYGFIGEETDENSKSTAWIVDPIDGTVAFARGLDEFGIALAFKNDTGIQFSLIYLPTKNELYTAIKDKGAFLNDKKITVSKVSALNLALLSIHKSTLLMYASHSQNLLDLSFRLRVTHAASSESCHLASGRIDGLIKVNQALWDVAPEYLLMKEAGARITDEFGDDLIITFSKKARHNYIAVTNSLSEEVLKPLYFPKA